MNPFNHAPVLIERKANFISLMVRDAKPEVTGYKLWASKTPAGLWGTTTTIAAGGMGAVGADATLRKELFRVKAGTYNRSKSIMQRKITYEEILRGTTRFLLDIEDFIDGADNPQPLANDERVLYFSLQQERYNDMNVVLGANGQGEDILGPILVVPVPTFYSMVEGSILISGYAPGGVVVGAPPFGQPFDIDLDQQKPNPLHLVFTHPTVSYVIRNLHDTLNLYVSTGVGQPYTTLLPGQTLPLFGSVKDFLFASSSADTACPFAIDVDLQIGGTSSQ